MSDSVRWMVKVTDSVCSGCRVQSSAAEKATREAAGLARAASVRRTIPNRVNPARIWIAKFKA